MTRIDQLLDQFRKKFTKGAVPRIFQAPGRVNLIGDHTDYNDGFVLPAAINRCITVVAAPREDRRVNVYAGDFNQWDRFEIQTGLKPLPKNSWANYLRAMVWSLLENGYDLAGMDAVIGGDIPMGSGLSSSAAMEVALGFALLTISKAAISRPRLARMAQQAENNFVGMRCGIMDQFISCLGEKDHALLIDCRDLSYRTVPIPSKATIVIVESGVKRQLVEGKYNARRKECEQAAAFFKVPKLRDIDLDQFNRHASKLPPAVRRRARHVVSENQRTVAAAKALENNDPAAAGRLMQSSHVSLGDDFEVSCPELDQLFKIATATKGVYGARLTGAGFGGCLVALAKKQATESLLHNIAEQYQPAGGGKAAAYICRPMSGAAEITTTKF